MKESTFSGVGGSSGLYSGDNGLILELGLHSRPDHMASIFHKKKGEWSKTQSSVFLSRRTRTKMLRLPNLMKVKNCINVINVDLRLLTHLTSVQTNSTLKSSTTQIIIFSRQNKNMVSGDAIRLGFITKD